jgi:hypothetical protein
MDQSVMTFADSTARGSAIGTATEGMLTYLEDSDRYDSWSGTAWVSALPTGAWTAFTPTWTSFTVGNGIYNRSHYQLSGKTAIVAVDFSLGSTSAVTGNLGITLPAELERATNFATGLAQSILADSTSGSFLGIPLASTANPLNWAIRRATGDPVFSGNTSATLPFTWAENDRIVFAATFEVA